MSRSESDDAPRREPHSPPSAGAQQSGPQPLGSVLTASLATVRASYAARANDPGERARIDRGQRARWEERLREAHARADARGVPGDGDVRAVCLRADCEGPLLGAVREALVWGRAQGLRTPVLRILLAGPGAGKSVALAWAVCDAVAGARYVLAPDVARHDRQHWRDAAPWAALVAVPVLALDELGTEDDPAPIAALWRERIDAGRVTIAGGNLDRATVRTRYVDPDPRLADRLTRQAKRGLRPTEVSAAPSRRTGPAPAPLCPGVPLAGFPAPVVPLRSPPVV